MSAENPDNQAFEYNRENPITSGDVEEFLLAHEHSKGIMGIIRGLGKAAHISDLGKNVTSKNEMLSSRLRQAELMLESVERIVAFARGDISAEATCESQEIVDYLESPMGRNLAQQFLDHVEVIENSRKLVEIIHESGGGPLQFFDRSIRMVEDTGIRYRGFLLKNARRRTQNN